MEDMIILSLRRNVRWNEDVGWDVRLDEIRLEMGKDRSDDGTGGETG